MKLNKLALFYNRNFFRNLFENIFEFFSPSVESMISKILIVGCGLTGSVTASLINHEATADITIWEREMHIGGRLFTFHNPNEPGCTVDLGAQYVETTLEFIRSHARFYDELLDKDKLIPLGHKIQNFRKLSETKTNFVSPEGSESLVQHFLKKSGAKLCLGYEVIEINLKEDHWEVKTKCGFVQTFDAVVLTIPIPEVLKLEGTFLQLINEADDTRMAMEQVNYSSRYAVGLLYNKPVEILEHMSWFAKYFPSDEIICFAAIDNRKRGNIEDLPSVLIHTNVKFSQEHWNKDEDEVKKIILDHVKCLLPELPEADYVKCHRWTYSQVTDAYIDNPGCIVLRDHPSLICGGDSFTKSDFNGGITSALRIVEEMLKCATIAKTSRNHQKKTSNVATTKC